MVFPESNKPKDWADAFCRANQCSSPEMMLEWFKAAMDYAHDAAVSDVLDSMHD